MQDGNIIVQGIILNEEEEGGGNHKLGKGAFKGLHVLSVLGNAQENTSYSFTLSKIRPVPLTQKLFVGTRVIQVLFQLCERSFQGTQCRCIWELGLPFHILPCLEQRTQNLNA